jgi:hypothetical protein
MNQLLTTCPVCANELAATRLKCVACDTVIEGSFALGRLGRLSKEQLRFVELLVKNRGNINQVASDMGVSYTTARTRMDEIVTALGYTPPAEDSAATHRRDILRRLEAGELTAEEALRMLKS